MSVQMVRFSTDAERVHEVEDAIAALFTAVSAAAPTGMTYAAGRVGDGPDFVFLLQLAEGVDNPLLGIPDALDSAAGSLDGRLKSLHPNFLPCWEGMRADVGSRNWAVGDYGPLRHCQWIRGGGQGRQGTVRGAEFR